MRRRLDRLIDIAARDHGRVGMVIGLREADLGAMALDLARSEAKGYERSARAMRRASKRIAHRLEVLDGYKKRWSNNTARRPVGPLPCQTPGPLPGQLGFAFAETATPPVPNNGSGEAHSGLGDHRT